MVRELRESRCTGFCRLIQFSSEAKERVKQLIFRMVLASLRSYKKPGVRSRAIGVISGTPALIVTDAYLGVCCSSLKKICGIIKKHILGEEETTKSVGRNTTYDAKVTPNYRAYAHSAENVGWITAKYINPPAEVVKRWIELCRP